MTSAQHDAGQLEILRQMGEDRAVLQENTAATAQIMDNTGELVEAFAAMKGAFKVFNWIGAAAKPLGWIIAAIASVIAFIATIKGVKP